MWIEYNPNPMARRVGDCSVRAVAKALNLEWEDAFVELAAMAFQMADMPSSDAVWGAVLRKHGFCRQSIPDSCPDCYTAEDFANSHPDGVYVLGFGGHVATVDSGNLYDSWCSLDEQPQFVWYRKDGQ